MERDAHSMVSKLDKRIIEILQSDARVPISEIARAVDMSENGVRYRLERLENSGHIVGYTALLNPRKFNKSIIAIFNINTAPEKTNEIIMKLRDMEEFTKIYQTTGKYTITAIGLFRNTDDLNAFVSSKILIDGIVDFNVDIVTKKHKDSTFSV